MRDRVKILLRVRAGLRAKEIAAEWGYVVMDAVGNLGDALHLPNVASSEASGQPRYP